MKADIDDLEVGDVLKCTNSMDLENTVFTIIAKDQYGFEIEYKNRYSGNMSVWKPNREALKYELDAYNYVPVKYTRFEKTELDLKGLL